MMFYPLTGEEYALLPLSDQVHFQSFKQLCNKKDFCANSQIRSDELNFFDSYSRFEALASDDLYWVYNRIFLIAAKEQLNLKPGHFGIIGLKDMDMIQCRAELVLIADNDAIKQKLAYEPLKLILNQAIRVVRFRRLWTRIPANDSQTTTIFKSFGFSVEGKLREEIKRGEETIDVNIMGLLGKEYHPIENE